VVILEIGLQNFRDAENILPERNRVQDIFLQVQTELNNFLGMATGTELAATATEGQQKLVMTVRAADTGEAF
jgi:hypothetical protein